jgi:hypothetical protein
VIGVLLSRPGLRKLIISSMPLIWTARKRTASVTQLIGITMGCPVGIGPEIILKFFTSRAEHRDFLPVVLGDAGVLHHALPRFSTCSPTLFPGNRANPVRPGSIPVCNLSALSA